MDLHSKQQSDLLKEFTKCGYIYKSSAIGEKHQLLLSCLHCNEVFCQLDNFLEHSVKHLELRDFCTDVVEEDSLDIDNTMIKTERIECESETLIPDAPVQQEDSKMRLYHDNLDQEGNEFFEILPESVKTENIEEIERPAQIDGHKTIEDDNCSDVDFEMDHLNINQRPSGSKRTSSGTFKSREEQIQQWLEEESEHEFSDVDDEDNDPNFQLENELFEDDEISDEEADKELSACLQACPEILPTTEEAHQETSGDSPEYYKGKNGFMWNRRECPKTSRTATHNILRLPGRLPTSNFEGYLALWLKLFDMSMLECLVLFTNQKLSTYRGQFKNSTKIELMDTDLVEMKAFIGLMYYTSVFKCNDADLRLIFATDGTGHEIFRCVMSKLRFSCLINCLRFDDSTTRQERLKEDPIAPISDIFNKFISNSQSQYICGPYLCIDEMLLPFRGRCKFIIYMPQKPAKYGIKIMLLADARTYYIYNAYIYYGKNSDGIGMSEEEKKLSVPSQSVLRLVKGLENSNRNITADNWFSSIPLMEMLLKKGLTYLGTLKKNKAEIPSCFLPSKHREVESSLYGFTKQYTLLSYVPRKNKAVLLISSSHHNQEVDPDTKKPIMITDYNHTKGGVDEIDKKCSIYSCSRKTRRWPIAIFQRVLDMVGVNSFVLYQMCGDSDDKMRRKTFMLNLARELVLDHMKARVYNERLPRELRILITGVLGKDLPPPPPTIRSITPSGRKLCCICPTKIKRVTRYCCCDCRKPICLQCSKPLCETCQTKL